MSDKLTVTFQVLPDGEPQQVQGRDAWALLNLIEKGEKGVTSIDTPGPRWSAYVFKLRKAGVVIETQHETHGGSFPGSHARYILRSQCQLLSGSDTEAA